MCLSRKAARRKDITERKDLMTVMAAISTAMDMEIRVVEEEDGANEMHTVLRAGVRTPMGMAIQAGQVTVEMGVMADTPGVLGIATLMVRDRDETLPFRVIGNFPYVLELCTIVTPPMPLFHMSSIISMLVEASQPTSQKYMYNLLNP